MRDLAQGSYTHDQVLDRIKDGTARTGVRLDLLDEHRQKIGELETVTADSGGAVVEHNIDQGVKGSLDLKMAPDERLRNIPYRRYVQPFWQIQMPDGGWVEYPFGVYVWTVPDKDVTLSRLEDWQIVLPDQLDIFNTQSPLTSGGYTVYPGEQITYSIKQILRINGITDWSRIDDSPKVFDQVKSWFFSEPKTPEYEEFRRIQSELRTPEGMAKLWYWIRFEQLQNVGVGQVQTGQTSWLSILEELHASLAWWPPHFDWDGRYVGRSGIDPEDMKPAPALRYVTDARSITRGLKTSVNIAQFANTVMKQSSNPNGFFGTEFCSADDFLPDHPLAPRQCRRQILKASQESNVDNSQALQDACVLELFQLMNTTDKAQWTTHVNPAHEPYDFMSIHVPSHPDLIEPALYHEHMLALDLYVSDMEHGGYRCWIKEPLYGLLQ